MSLSVEKSRQHIRGFLITAAEREGICGVLLGGEDETALYTLSGHLGARTAEVSSKRKPLKAECFDVTGSNRGLSLYSCLTWSGGKKRKNAQSLPVPGVLSRVKSFSRAGG